MRTLGVLGGMGPQATVDFLQKIVVATPASVDQEHLPMLVHFHPQIPDRTQAIMGTGPSPLPALIGAARALEAAGAEFIAIPCNTAHVWFSEIAAALNVPVFHIADTSVDSVKAHGLKRPGLLATKGTLASGIYNKRHQGLAWVLPEPCELEDWVMPAIRAIKANRLEVARELLLQAGRRLIKRGADGLVLGCTEIPVVIKKRDFDVPVIDSTYALAKSCITWSCAASS